MLKFGRSLEAVSSEPLEPDVEARRLEARNEQSQIRLKPVNIKPNSNRQETRERCVRWQLLSWRQRFASVRRIEDWVP